jgi:hypothetical protein
MQTGLPIQSMAKRQQTKLVQFHLAPKPNKTTKMEGKSKTMLVPF